MTNNICYEMINIIKNINIYIYTHKYLSTNMHFLACSSIQGIKDFLKDLSCYLVFPMPEFSDWINFFYH